MDDDNRQCDLKFDNGQKKIMLCKVLEKRVFQQFNDHTKILKLYKKTGINKFIVTPFNINNILILDKNNN